MAGREPWRLLHTWDGGPGWNMALDEALLASADPRPALRFYTWRPPALSLGYFQRWEELAQVAARAGAVVRRFSGGGAIHHADELTYSIAAAREHALFRGDVRSSYERVHGVLARAFAVLGLRAELRGDARASSDRPASGMCFHRSTPLDLVWNGAKGVGSAQRRSGGRVLHHGSIKLGQSELEPGVAALRGHGREVDAQGLARLVAEAFEEELGCSLALEEPTPAEREHAARRAAFYGSPEFVRRR